MFDQRISARVDEQNWAKNVALDNKSSLWEGIFVDDKGVNCTNLEVVRAQKYFTKK